VKIIVAVLAALVVVLGALTIVQAGRLDSLDRQVQQQHALELEHRSHDLAVYEAMHASAACYGQPAVWRADGGGLGC
jgi:Tfp pilus assembly protein PilO